MTTEVRAARASRSAAAVAIVAFVVGVAANWMPSYWYDEVATVYSSRRSLPDLIDLLRSTDVVHGLYYVGMHYWGGVFGFSEFSTRLPSALAVGVAAGGVVVLGTRLAGPRVGMLAGLVFAVLPRVTWAAVEARSYALTAAFAVWLTIVFLVALHGSSRKWWVLYSALLAVSIVLFVYLATIVAAHALIMLVRKRFRATAEAWVVSVAVAVVVALPFVDVALRQARQVSWIPPIDGNFPRVVLEYQWFLGAPAFGVLVAVVLLAAVGVTLRQRSHPGNWHLGIVPVALPWILVPMSVMATYSMLKTPIYLDRYFTFTTPAVALVIGAALDRLARPRWLPYLLLAGLVVAQAPSYLQQRSQWAKPLHMDFSDANDFAAANVRPDDCVLFGRAAWNPSSQRLIEDVNPSAFAGSRSIGLGKQAASADQLWDDEIPLPGLTQQLSTCAVVWYFTDRERADTEYTRLTSNDRWTLPPYNFESSADYATLRDAGFRIESRDTFEVTQAIRLVR